MGVILAMANQASAQYLSDTPELISFTQQGWGQLGIDTCAHQPGQTPLPMQIKDERFAKGLGHHAPGEIIVDLDGLYETFEAEVGVQWQGGNVGSVVFQVFVDDDKRFDSGIMKEQDDARPISISVAGAQELRLVVTDAGDGIACDCADWANARLIKSASPKPMPPAERVDIGQFAQVVTSDPSRTDGCRSNRVEEFRAEDIYLETPITPSKSGAYSAPNGCIGLDWMERRLVREVGIEFAGKPPSVEGVQVQAWVGNTSHQGNWKPVMGTIERDGSRWTLAIDRKENADLRAGIWKVRWTFPSAEKIRRLSAFTNSRYATAELLIQLEKPRPGKRTHIEVYNGEFVGAKTIDWDMGKPMRVKVRYSIPRPWKYDRTVLRFPDFGVAVDDVLANECVYVRDAGVFVSRGELNPAKYLNEITSRKTVLTRVREMPDQTFEQAMAKTRNPIQDNGPTMISLACDNSKFVIEQNGTVRFAASPQKADQVPPFSAQFPYAIVPEFGNGKVYRIDRHLDGGWLPVPVSTFSESRIIYRERSFVVPHGQDSLCVVEFTVENPRSISADISLGLTFVMDAGLAKSPRGVVAEHNGRLLALVESPLASIEGGKVVLRGTLPAGGKTSCFVYLPAWEMKAEDYPQLIGGEDLLADVKAYWERVMAPAMQIEIPDPLLRNVIRASQVHCMMASRNEADGARIAAWAGADRYGALESESHSIIRGMDLMGQEEFARRSLDYFIHRYDPAGFLTTGYTLMGTGWNLWTLGEHYQLTHDDKWLKENAAGIARVCDWITSQRRKTMKKGMPEYGLMPPGVMADWNNFVYYFCLNGYYCAGLRNSAEALKKIGCPGAEDFLKEASAFKDDILRAYRGTQSRSPVVPLQDGTWVNAYPSQVYCPGPSGNFFPGEDGNRSWCYDVELGAHQLVPQGILDPDSREVTEMMDNMEDVQFLSDGWFDYPADKNHADWFNLGGFSKVQPYYCRNAEVYALRDDVRPFIRSYFNTIATLLSTENLSLWEHFHNSGGWNKTHETGYFLQQSRWMLVMERGDQLWLAPFVTNNWLKDGMVVAVSDAPTQFGKVSYRIESHVGEGLVNVTVEPPRRNPPKEIVIRLRHPEGKPIRSVKAGAVKVSFDAETIHLTENLPEKLTLSVEY